MKDNSGGKHRNVVNFMKTRISGIVPGSIAQELGIENGDYLVSINDVSPVDLIDYRFLIADQNIELEIEKVNQEIWCLDIEKDEDEDLGIIFEQDTFDGIKRCKNKCIFCFVDQMPPNLRDTLYIKDDDYRMSFFHGNFVTLTNLTENDINRIKRMRISPLYISVHTTDGKLRQSMLKNPHATNIYNQLKDLAQAGIELHTQIVLCPGINDGASLEKSINMLVDLWPQVQSVAVVPVGLTKYQRNPDMRTFTAQEAGKVIKDVSSWQKKFLTNIGSNFVFLADEFYLMGGVDIPSYDSYEGFPQLENGVGLVRLLWHSFEEFMNKLPTDLEELRKVALVTGTSAGEVLKPIINTLRKINNLEIDLIQISNEFFGDSVTVAGLLTGSDLIIGLDDWRKDQIDELPEVCIPSVMLKNGENVFLDGMSVADVEKKLQIKLTSVDPTGKDMVNAVLGNNIY